MDGSSFHCHLLFHSSDHPRLGYHHDSVRRVPWWRDVELASSLIFIPRGEDAC
jgi:hypothetical protein